MIRPPVVVEEWRKVTNTTIQQNKAQQIENYFVDNPYVEFTTTDLHMRFGPSFRSRVSEINRNPKRKVTIKNRTTNRRVYQSSVYWAEPVVAEVTVASH